MVAPAESRLKELKKKLAHAMRVKSCCAARGNYLDFIKLMFPKRGSEEDYTQTTYEVKAFHEVIANVCDMVDRGSLNRVIISVPPRHGKSETAAKKLISYLWGRKPERHIIYATYGLDLSKECGADVIHTMNTERYQQVFPDVKLRKGGSAKDRIQTEPGGVGVFVGRGGPITGKGAHVLIVDDIVKDDEEAMSDTTMEKIWQWYNKVASTRLMDDKSAIIIIMTRWGENDIIGRITDPDSPNYDPEEAGKWHIIRIPALCDDATNDPMGRPIGQALWPERFSEKYLDGMRRQDPRGFACLQQQNPTPEDGAFFKADSIREYQIGKHPEDLRIYAAADYAVSTKQHNDATCMLIVGVDGSQNIWLLDCWWHKLPADRIVEAQLKLIEKWKPLVWWAEKGHISKSLGPFLMKRMRDEGIFAAIEEVQPVGDKQTRAQAIKGYMSMGKVYFPKNAYWFGPAISQILKFGGGARFDDFVDALSLVGKQLARMNGKRKHTGYKEKFKRGTFGQFKEGVRRQHQYEQNLKDAAGF